MVRGINLSFRLKVLLGRAIWRRHLNMKVAESIFVGRSNGLVYFVTGLYCRRGALLTIVRKGRVRVRAWCRCCGGMERRSMR